jgi:hypothetical protein
MEIEVFTLCDAAADYQGRLNILGIFDSIVATTLPATHPQCTIALRLRYTRTEVGEHSLVIHIVDHDGKQIMPEINGQFGLQIAGDDRSSTINLIMNMQGLVFTQYGEHAINLAIDKNEIASLPFWIRQPQQHP